jgi:hypothetical protein
MKLGLKIKRILYRRIVKPAIIKLYKMEGSLAKRPHVIIPDELSPVRFDIPMHIVEFVESGNENNLMNRSTIRPMLSIFRSELWLYNMY